MGLKPRNHGHDRQTAEDDRKQSWPVSFCESGEIQTRFFSEQT